MCRLRKDKTQQLCFLLNFPLCLQKGKKWVLTHGGSHGQGLHLNVRWFSGQGWGSWISALVSLRRRGKHWVCVPGWQLFLSGEPRIQISGGSSERHR